MHLCCMNSSLNHISFAKSNIVIAQIFKQLGKNTVIVFEGQMGSGKTTLIKGICAFLKVTDNITSPTYGLVNEYATEDKKKIYHFDFYRINHIDEAFDIGIEEYLSSGNLCLIEWADKITEILPLHYLKVKITVNDATRNYIVEEI